ncbi:YheC/YheD family protein [Bacillus sp. FJAT-29790]|uniref:YheC/YheD family endospore coat-associated protein n=1 Tax=Bacillus sp. FJAT-29790 TaxID=1895002 RepID=UPI001C227E9E|nr:YheC/YheD family protein [Bacillus sp. FJAT-29790]MBU8880037.1 YheC/YheD family protein [Bacillus sp. FJAT-29790]
MNIYYDRRAKKWFFLSNLTKMTFGSSRLPIQSLDALPVDNIHSFQVQSLNNNIGPLIGILTGRGKDHSVVGNGPFFKELQKEILKNGGISVVFTPQDLNEETIDGFVYSPEEGKWFPILCPLPHLVFNRVPFRSLEKSSSFEDCFRVFKDRDIPFFNPCFLNKYELHQLLMKDSILRPYLPETILASTESLLYEFLKTHNNLYLKPVSGAKGKGIYQIFLHQNETIELNGLKQSYSFSNFPAFWNEWEDALTEGLYIAQETIVPSLFDGKRFDFRILAHSTKKGYQVTGTGVRLSKDQEITTHVPNGGVLIPYEQIQTAQHDQFFEMVVERAGNILTAEKGFFGEFSIDAGVTETGKYVIYEINSKPMSFDEKEIEKRRIQTLAQLFAKMAGFD